MAISPNVCAKKYYTNAKASQSQLNVIVPNDIGGLYEYEFPYPFQILGLATVGNLPPIGGYGSSLITISSAPEQNLFKYMCQNMFIAMMYANRDYDPDVLFGSTIYAPTQMWPGFINYFQNYLNDELKPLWYNKFLMDGSMAIQYWQQEAATPSPALDFDRLRRFAQFQFEQSNRQLWGCPGLYTLYPGAVIPEVVWEPEMGYGSLDSTVLSGLSVYYNGQLPNVPVGFNVPTFPMNYPGLIPYIWFESNVTPGLIVWGSDVVPYVGIPANFSAEDFYQDLTNWIAAIIETETGMISLGDPFDEDLSFFAAGWGIGLRHVVADNTYDIEFAIGSAGGFAGSNSKLHVKFTADGTPAAWAADFTEFIAAADGPPTLLVNEYKPVE